jgi:hypothetical protein
MRKERRELLNSEGPILVTEKIVTYRIVDQFKEVIAHLSESEMQDFIHGDMRLIDSEGRDFKYSEYPGSMKPNLKKLDEFIGINTNGKIY